MTNILGKNGKPITCETCANKGYYKLKEKQDVFMFCACSAGVDLKQISIEWRLSDMKSIAESIIPRLHIIKERLGEPEKAKVFIETLAKELEDMKEKAEQGLK